MRRHLFELLDVEVQRTRTCAAATRPGWSRNVKDRPQPQVDARSACVPAASAPSTTSSTSPTMSCSNTASRCTPLTTAMSRAARSSCAALRHGETLTTLDGNRPPAPARRCLSSPTTHKPVGLAGHHGRRKQRRSWTTRYDVVFESANFNGTSIRKTAHGARACARDASAKFEKDLDPMTTLSRLCNRACELVELLGAGEVMDGVIDVLERCPAALSPVTLEPARINALARHRHPRGGYDRVSAPRGGAGRGRR